MDAPLSQKTDLRPWRSQIEALLVGIPMNPVVRRELLDAFEERGLLAYTEPESEIAVDELVIWNRSSPHYRRALSRMQS
jgi:hypothetical protein